MTQPIKSVQITLTNGMVVDAIPDSEIQESARPSLEIGMSYKSEDRHLVDDYPVPPAFRCLFVPPDKGMPNLQGLDMQRTPARTVPWWHHKDLPDTDKISEAWSVLAKRYPGRLIRWTFDHEANDKPYDRHVKGWETLSALKAVHPNGDQIKLCTVITRYFAVFKSLGTWRKWVLPDLVDEVAFDCYTPLDRPCYEDPSTMFGIVDQAQREYPHLGVGVAEFGAPLLLPDKGKDRALWFEDSIVYARERGYVTLGLWNSWEMRGSKKVDYRALDEPTITSWRGALSA